MIRADLLSKAFGSRSALSEVSFEVGRGEAVVVTGAPGGGRTTLLRVLGTLVPPSSGRAQIDGIDVVAHAFAVRRHVFLVGTPAVVVHDARVSEYLRLIGSTRASRIRVDESRIDALLERLGLGRDVPVNALSPAERSWLELAAAVAASAKVLLLDEPFSGLDTEDATRCEELIIDARTRGITVLATATTDAETRRFWDRTLVLDGGRMVGEQAARERLSMTAREGVGA
jgi:ABC-2 type transport system ATP-binding protein